MTFPPDLSGNNRPPERKITKIYVNNLSCNSGHSDRLLDLDRCHGPGFTGKGRLARAGRSKWEPDEVRHPEKRKSHAGRGSGMVVAGYVSGKRNVSRMCGAVAPFEEGASELHTSERKQHGC